MYLFKNTFLLFKFILKQEKIRALIFILLFVIVLSYEASSMSTIFYDPTSEEAIGMINMFTNPIFKALFGPIFGEYHTAYTLFGGFLLVFTIIIAAIYSILVMIKHTKKNEEDNNLEIIMSLPVGKLSVQTAAFIYIVVLNILLGIAIALTLSIMFSFPILGSLLFGLSISLGAIFFSLIALLCALLYEDSSRCLRMSFIILGILYIIRAFGDTTLPIISLISPVGLLTQGQVFVNNNILPMIIVAIYCVLLFYLVTKLAIKRDLNQPLLAANVGKNSASKSLKTTYGFVFKTISVLFISWAITLVLFNIFWGSMFEGLEYFLETGFFDDLIGGEALEMQTEYFLHMIFIIQVIFTTIPVISIFKVIVNQERKGLNEHLHSRNISKEKLLLTHLMYSVIFIIIFTIINPLILGIMFNETTDFYIPLSEFIITSLLAIPSIMFVLSILVFIIGFIPKLAGLAWLYVIFTLITMFLTGLPDFLITLNIFDHVDNAFIHDVNTTSTIIISLVSLVLITVGILKYRKRDMVFN